MQENLEYIIESLLFVSEEPLTVEKLKNILETVDAKEIRSALHTLVEQYDSRGGGFKLVEVAGGWQLRSRPEYNEWIKRMLKPPPQRLSKAALETLSIVAYNQPIIRADIEHIRGVDCGGVLRKLLERKLVRVLGRKEIPGRPLIYATTKLFLELFELKDLKDLPSPKEIEEMSAAAEEAAVPSLPKIDEESLFDISESDESASSEDLPKMRFSIALDDSISERPPYARPTDIISIQKSIQSMKQVDGTAMSSTRARIPANRHAIGQTPNPLEVGGVSKLPGAKGRDTLR